MVGKTLTQERLRELLDYDPLTGVFRWRVTRNGRSRAGSLAGRPHNGGYVAITVDRGHYLAHRVAWLYVHGAWPSEWLDHKDLDRANNRIANLREATGRQNAFNRPAPKHNTSGAKGVSWDIKNQKWRAHVTVGRKFKNLGRFSKFEDAVAAHLRGAELYAGEFAHP